MEGAFHKILQTSLLPSVPFSHLLCQCTSRVSLCPFCRTSSRSTGRIPCTFFDVDDFTATKWHHFRENTGNTKRAKKDTVPARLSHKIEIKKALFSPTGADPSTIFIQKRLASVHFLSHDTTSKLTNLPYQKTLTNYNPIVPTKLCVLGPRIHFRGSDRVRLNTANLLLKHNLLVVG